MQTHQAAADVRNENKQRRIDCAVHKTADDCQCYEGRQRNHSRSPTVT